VRHRVKAQGVEPGAVKASAHLRERDEVRRQGRIDGAEPHGEVAACPYVPELAELLLDVVRKEGKCRGGCGAKESRVAEVGVARLRMGKWGWARRVPERNVEWGQRLAVEEGQGSDGACEKFEMDAGARRLRCRLVQEMGAVHIGEDEAPPGEYADA
jgi:hypothetical protein